jgi:hypothetical protein
MRTYLFEVVLPSVADFATRNDLEDALEAALAPRGLGEVTGAGLGRGGAHLDVEVTDPVRGLAVIRHALVLAGAPSDTVIVQRDPTVVRHPLIAPTVH